MERYLTDLARKLRWWEIPAWTGSIILAMAAIGAWTEDSPVDEDAVVWLLAWIFAAAIMCLPLFGMLRRFFRRRMASRLARKLDAQHEAALPLDRLDEILGVRGSKRKIESLIRSGYLQHLMIADGQLWLDNPQPVFVRPPEPVRVETVPSDVLGQIRRLNERIDDAGVSMRIDRIERVTSSILHTIDERPDRADEARRFMSYYLPTTLKLLESYDLMEDQSYQGENIQASRRRIEAVLDKLVTAAELQQDRLFRSEALDVESEIRVLETMMASDGLSGEGGLQPLER